jgi:hypothetical protein
MSATEQELEEVQGLAARGQQVGGSTHPDVATATLELGLKEAGGDELHGVVDGCEIDLVDEIALIAPASLTIERRPRERIRQIENHSLKQLQYLHEAEKPRGGGETIQALRGSRPRAAPTRLIGP